MASNKAFEDQQRILLALEGKQQKNEDQTVSHINI